jgi:hypothetical protein
MGARWPAILAATFFLLLGCDVAPSELEGLSSANADAYVILRDQLDQMPERLGDSSESVTLCVTVRLPDDPEATHVDATLLARLQGHVPADLKAVLVPGMECHETGEGLAVQTGERALGLHAFFGMPGFEEWTAGYSCGALCGQGNTYSVYHIFGYPIAIRTGTFIS